MDRLPALCLEPGHCKDAAPAMNKLNRRAHAVGVGLVVLALLAIAAGGYPRPLDSLNNNLVGYWSFDSGLGDSVGSNSFTNGYSANCNATTTSVLGGHAEV